MWFVEHLDDNPIRVSTVKGGAPVSMDLEWVSNLHPFVPKLFFQLLYPLDGFDRKTEMI